MRDERRLRDGSPLPGADAAKQVATGELFATTDRLTARGILLRVGRRAVPVLPRAPLVAVLLAAVLAMPSTGRAQSAVRATASASVRILPSSVRVTGGAVVVSRGTAALAVPVIVITPPPVLRACDAGADGAPCRMLVVDLP